MRHLAHIPVVFAIAIFSSVSPCSAARMMWTDDPAEAYRLITHPRASWSDVFYNPGNPTTKIVGWEIGCVASSGHNNCGLDKDLQVWNGTSTERIAFDANFGAPTGRFYSTPPGLFVEGVNGSDLTLSRIQDWSASTLSRCTTDGGNFIVGGGANSGMPRSLVYVPPTDLYTDGLLLYFSYGPDYGSKIFYSTNNGVTWTLLRATGTTIRHFHGARFVRKTTANNLPSEPGRLYVFTGDANYCSALLFCDDVDDLIAHPTTWFGSTRWGLDGTLATVTFYGSTNTVGWTGHQLANGTEVKFVAGGGLPAELSDSTTYYSYSEGTNSFSICDTYAHAIAGTNKIDFGDGTYPNYCNAKDHLLPSSDYCFNDNLSSGQPSTGKWRMCDLGDNGSKYLVWCQDGLGNTDRPMYRTDQTASPSAATESIPGVGSSHVIGSGWITITLADGTILWTTASETSAYTTVQGLGWPDLAKYEYSHLYAVREDCSEYRELKKWRRPTNSANVISYSLFDAWGRIFVSYGNVGTMRSSSYNFGYPELAYEINTSYLGRAWFAGRVAVEPEAPTCTLVQNVPIETSMPSGWVVGPDYTWHVHLAAEEGTPGNVLVLQGSAASNRVMHRISGSTGKWLTVRFRAKLGAGAPSGQIAQINWHNAYNSGVNKCYYEPSGHFDGTWKNYQFTTFSGAESYTELMLVNTVAALTGAVPLYVTDIQVWSGVPADTGRWNVGGGRPEIKW